MKFLSEETRVTIGLVLAICTGVFFVSGLDARTVAVTVKVEKNSTRIDAMEGKIEALLIGTERANTKLDILIDERQKRH